MMLIEISKDFATVAFCSVGGFVAGNLGLPTFVHLFGGTKVGQAVEAFTEMFRPENEEPIEELLLATKVGTYAGSAIGFAAGVYLAIN